MVFNATFNNISVISWRSVHIYIYIYILRQFFKKLKQNCVCYIIPLYILVHVLRLGLMLYLSTILFLFTMQVLGESTSVFLLNLFYL
jgi:hypothetical protein